MPALPTTPVAASSGSFLVSPNVGLMLWTLLVFGISLYVLAKLAFPRIAEALDKRQKAIEESIETSERVRAEATTDTEGDRLAGSGPGVRLGEERDDEGEGVHRVAPLAG